MAELNLNPSDYAQIWELVVTANKKRLNALLGFKPRNSRFEAGAGYSEVAPSTPKACALLNMLRSNLSKQTKKCCGGHDEKYTLALDDIFQALLMIDPSYITPWNALDEFASSLYNYSGSVIHILQCMSSIEEFLLKTEFSFALSRSHPTQNNVPRCIRELMVQCAEKLSTQYGTRDLVLDRLASELIRTILTVCKGWCNDLFDSIVSVLHLRRPSATRMKIWLQLAQLSQPQLSNEHTEKIARIVADQFCDISIKKMPRQDMLSIISIAVEMANPDRTVTIDQKSSDHANKLWRKSLFLVLYQISINQSDHCYIDAEKYLTDGVKKWSVNSLKSWVAEVIDDYSLFSIGNNHKTIPSWFTCNFLSLCTEILRGDDESLRLGLVDTIMDHNLQESKAFENCMSEQEYQSILNFVLGNEGISLTEQDIDEVCYRFGGLFCLQGDDKKNIDPLSACGSLVVQSLQLKESNTFNESIRRNHSSALFVPRAIRLVNMVDDIATKYFDDHCVLQASIFAIVAKTVAYFEVPDFRSILELRIKQGVSESSRLQNSHISTLRLITASALKMGRNDKIIDRWNRIIDMSLPFSHGTYLGRMFATLPLTQVRILGRSKKLLAPLYSNWGSHRDDIGTSERTAEPIIHQRSIDGMRGLFELVRSDRWKKNEVEAWVILSDSLVADLPPLPLKGRRWILQTFRTSVTDGVFSAETLDHLLRAATIRISSFFVHDNTMSNIPLIQSRQMEEIKSLHRLMTILFRSLASVSIYSESRHILLAQGRESFLRSILSYKKGQLSRNQFRDGILKKYYSIKDTDVDSFSFCWLLFLKVNFFILDHTMTESFKPKHIGGSSVKDETSFLEFAKGIKKIEGRELHLKVGTGSEYPNLLPSWINAESNGGFRSEKPISSEPTKTSTSKLPWLDILLEFLFLVPLPTRESHDFNDPLPWKVITATGFLTSQKNRCALSIETIKETAEPFLSISSLLVRKALRLDCDLSVIEDLLVPTVSYCRALHLTMETVELPDCARIVGSLWNLYQAVASEKACVKIIKYLESHISENGDASIQREQGVFSLSSVYNESDVDETVQKLRLYCLRPFLCCLSFMSNSEETDSRVSRSLVGGILGALATDLRAGLNGNSGGLPRELYITYCILIEECASLLFNLKHPSLDCSILLLFKEVATALANILITIPLRDAVLFRTTFILAAVVFPSMCRDLTRHSLCYSDSSSQIIDDEMLRFDSAIFEEVLKDCVEILIRWAALREPYLIPWLDISGPDHSDIEIDATQDEMNCHDKSSKVAFGSKQAYDGDIPRFVHVPFPSSNRRKSDPPHNNRRRRIRLHTKEVWSWALSCSLLGLEQKWLESERTIQTSKAIESRDGFQDSLVNWKKFFGSRKTELRKSLGEINRFFHTSPGLAQRDQNGNQVLLDMVAMNLPSAPRSRLCCLIECISRVLIHSVQRLRSFLLRGKNILTRDLSIFESICCLSAWLSFDGNPDEDFSVGLFRWLAIASRKRPPDESTPSTKSDTSELFEQVSTVSHHVHKLYLTLKEFQKALRNHHISNEQDYQSELIWTFFDGEDTADEVLRLTAQKLHSLQQVMPRDFQTQSFPDFPSDNSPETVSQSPGRKRTRLEKRLPNPKSKTKRLRHKNRNKVVDIFMDLDQGTNSPRQNPSRDTYADLEDFLVEG